MYVHVNLSCTYMISVEVIVYVNTIREILCYSWGGNKMRFRKLRPNSVFSSFFPLFFQQLEMKLSDCAELYEKRRERLVLKHRDARTAHVCNRILICSCLMVLISYIIRCLQTPHELCFQEH